MYYMAKTINNELTIIIITYNSERYLNSCLNSIKNHKIVIVDNNSKDNTLEIAKKHNVKTIVNKTNYGYAKAANIGINNSNSDYILLINPDVSFQEDTIEKMLCFMRENKRCDVQGPKLINSKGELLYSCKRFPRLKDAIARRVGIFEKAAYYHLMKDYGHREPKLVDWVSGGCILFKNQFKFDERFFLYLEDVDFCHNKQVYYNPNAIAFHTVQRLSAEKLLHFFYHFISFLKYKMKYMFNSNMHNLNNFPK